MQKFHFRLKVTRMIPANLNTKTRILSISKSVFLCTIPITSFVVAFLAFLSATSLATAASVNEATGHEFFEKKVRPVLVEQCYKCHSKESEKLKGGLFVDSAEGLLKGGDTGPAIVAGDLNKSLLIKAIRYQDEDLQMPPKGKKLTPAQIADLEEWVRIGAPDPRTNQVSSTAVSSVNHWAFKPVRATTPPKVKNAKWPQSPVDTFILAKLEENKLKPSSAADRRTLIRRAYFDLIGLPPTMDEVDAFVKDKSKDAFEKVVDHLLSLPAYGERWGRHWLDVARYADTKGYVFEEERKYGYSYTYRDYVIRSFNQDLPYDQFIKEQLAADLLQKGDDKSSLAAMGFLTLGRRFLNNPHDIIDDRIDVVSRGLLGLTVACARCHDHKYDPIPTKDYYSLYGVFASANEPADKPLLGTNSFPKEYPEYVAEHEKWQKEITDFVDLKQKETLRSARNRTGDYLLTSYEGNLPDQNSKKEKIARERKLDPEVANRWTRSLESWLKQTNEFAVFWKEATSLATNDFETAYSALLEKHAALTAAFAKSESNKVDSLPKVAELLNKTFMAIETKGAENSSTNKVALSSVEKSLFDLIHQKDGPFDFPKEHFNALYDVPTAQKIRALNRKLAELDAQHPGSPPKAMVLAENGQPTTPHVFVRGNPGNQGPEVTRHFLQVIAGQDPKPFPRGSGRLDMAEAIASKDNPLTARVYVNRVWLLHFGSGIVSTPSDFGMRSDPPSHPELLDFLATQFIESGWSTKKLHKLMMLSSTYQQSSESNPAFEAVDQSNRWYWKMNRQRLDLEALRDTLLAVSGKLDKSIGGHPVEITTDTYSPRRTVYGFIDRQNLPGFFRTFDFASPDTSSSKRFYTTVPQQALFLLNSPFVVDQARTLASQLDTNAIEKEVTTLYERVLQRKPRKEELTASKSFLSTPASNDGSENSPWSFGYGELDLQAGKLVHFEPLTVFKDKSWQGGDKLPDDKLGWVQITATGGHPGNDLKHAGVRRWTAPASGTYQISGKIAHTPEQGDGVRASVITKKGLLKSWEVKHDSKETVIEEVALQKGDVVDFVVDPKESVSFDSYSWSPTLTLRDAKDKNAKTAWNSETDFGGLVKKKVPLTRLEELAQVLLLTNELSFVD